MSGDNEIANLRRDIERFKSLTSTIKSRHSLITLHEIIREAERHLARLEERPDPIPKLREV